MAHNSDEHIQVTIGSSKTQLIREKVSGGLLTTDTTKKITNGGQDFQAVSDIQVKDLLQGILAELKIHTKHLEQITDEEFK
jgi:hypothetical protein